jgi:hypothetical protein
MATDTAGDLYERLTDLLGKHDVHPADRATIQDAYYDGATWDDLPADVQALIVENEKLPVQSWDDPSDVPDHIFTD